MNYIASRVSRLGDRGGWLREGAAVRWLSLVGWVVLFGCAKAPPPKPVVQPPKPVAPADAVKGLMASLYEAVQAGDADRLAQAFTEDAMVFGLGPSDTWSSREAVVTYTRQAFLPLGLSGDTLAISESRVAVGLAPGEKSAWLYDLPKVVVGHGRDDHTYLPRLTGHAVKDGTHWRLDALHVSLAVSDALVARPDASRLLLPPAAVPDERGPDADQVVGLARRMVEDMGVKVEHASERPAFVWIGTSPVELFEGGKTFKDLVRPQLPAIKKGGYAWRLEGPLRARLASDGETGWAAGVVVLRIGSGKKAQTLPPFRVLWVFADEDGVWNMVSEHQSLAVKEDLREPADAEQLKAWQGLRQVAAQRAAEAKQAEKPAAEGPGDASSSGGAPREGQDGGAPIEAW
jgi:uncharacterized protein (TIGR02246 family)